MRNFSPKIAKRFLCKGSDSHFQAGLDALLGNLSTKNKGYAIGIAFVFAVDEGCENSNATNRGRFVC